MSQILALFIRYLLLSGASAAVINLTSSGPVPVRLDESSTSLSAVPFTATTTPDSSPAPPSNSTTTSASSAPSASSVIPPNSITICLNSGCSNCTAAITSTPDNVGTYPNCVAHSTSLLAGRGYTSPIGGQGVNAFFNMPQPPIGCAWLVLRPAAMNSMRCGLPNLYVEQGGCFFTNLQSSFTFQKCCGNQCAFAFPPGARRRRRRSLEHDIVMPSIESPPGEVRTAMVPPTIIPPTYSALDGAQIAFPFEQKPVSRSSYFNKSSHSSATTSLAITCLPATTTTATSSTNDSLAGLPPLPTKPPAPHDHELARRWRWPWDPPQTVTMPQITPITPPGMPTSILGLPYQSPVPTAVQLECSGKILLASPAIRTEGAQIRIGSDVDCGASNAACSQTDTLTVHRGYNIMVQTIDGISFKVSAIAESLTTNLNILLGFQLDYSTDTSLASSLTIPPGSRGVLTWTPYYKCGMVTASGCNQGVGTANITACSPILDGSRRAVGEYTVVTVG